MGLDDGWMSDQSQAFYNPPQPSGHSLWQQGALDFLPGASSYRYQTDAATMIFYSAEGASAFGGFRDEDVKLRLRDKVLGLRNALGLDQEHPYSSE